MGRSAPRQRREAVLGWAVGLLVPPGGDAGPFRYDGREAAAYTLAAEAYELVTGHAAGRVKPLTVAKMEQTAARYRRWAAQLEKGTRFWPWSEGYGKTAGPPGNGARPGGTGLRHTCERGEGI